MKIVNRRAFIGSAAALGAAAMITSCAPSGSGKKEASKTADAQAEATDLSGWKLAEKNPAVVPLVPFSAPKKLTDEEVEDLLENRAVVTEDFVNSDGTAVAPEFQMVRNTVNRCGIGVGSLISKDHQFDLWKRLYTEEEAQAINEMPMYQRFTAAEFAEICGKSVGDCTKLCNQIADKGMLHREHDDDGETRFFVVGSEYGYYEANIFNIDADFLKLKDATGSEDIDVGPQFVDSGTSLYRSYPVDLDVVVDGNYTEWEDWRAIFSRNDTFSVSPCVCRCRQLIQAGKAANAREVLDKGLTLDEHPVETCICTGKHAEYMIEIGAGRQISAEEAISIVEDGISKGMIVESVYTKAAENICLCHCDCCLNVGAVRTLNGGPALEAYSNFNLVHRKDDCIKCGTCVERCPMKAITLDPDGYPIVDNACVRCGQCATVCPKGARGLLRKNETELHEIPETLVDDYVEKARVRASKGYLYDFTGQSSAKAPAAAE